MLQPQLLSPQANSAVEDNFAENILYRFLALVCKPILADGKEFAIFPGELFYHCVFTIDSLKDCTPPQLRERCVRVVDDITEHFISKDLDKDDLEVNRAICLITYSVERCLALIKDPAYTFPAVLMENRLLNLNSSFTNTLMKRFNSAIKRIGEDDLSDSLQLYMQSPEYLSDQLNKLIDEHTSTTYDKPTKEDLEATFTYPYRKTTGYQLLITYLQNEKRKTGRGSDTNWARHAYYIYESNPCVIRNRPQTFKEWLTHFCKIFGHDEVPYMEPNKLKNKKSTIDSFLL